MKQQAKDLAERLSAFNNDLLAFVDNCSEEDWRKVCSGEGWTVGVVAHHVAAGHCGSLDLVKMIVAGETLPPLTMDVIHKMNAQHAREHADCTREEVLALLRENGAAFVDYLAGLSDTELHHTAYLAAIDDDVSAQQIVEMIILQSAGDHLTSMKDSITQ